MGTEKENELSCLCGMIQNGKISYKDAVYYLELMKEEYEITEQQFRKLYMAWIQNGELCRELNRIRRTGKKESSYGLYRQVLNGMYEMVEAGEMDLTMLTEDLWKDTYEIKKAPSGGLVGFYPELPGCIGYGENPEKLHKNMKTTLKNWIRAAYEQWREGQIISGNADGISEL